MGGGGKPGSAGQSYAGGEWGNLGSPIQKGITSYALSPNRQRPLAGTGTEAFWNTWRRIRGQAWYILPPVLIGYAVMSWAAEKNRYLNSKAGMKETAEREAAAAAKE